MGTRVRLKDLAARADMNGLKGIVMSFLAGNQRYLVKVNGREFKLREANLLAVRDEFKVRLLERQLAARQRSTSLPSWSPRLAPAAVGLLEVLMVSLRESFRKAGCRQWQPGRDTLGGHRFQLVTEAGGSGLHSLSSTSEDYLEGPVLRYRRYSHVTRDIEYILQVPGVARSLLAGGYGKTASVEDREDGKRELSPARHILVLSRQSPERARTVLLQMLALTQYMDAQKRAARTHVEYENRKWVHAFSFMLPVMHLMDLLVEQGLKDIKDQPKEGGEDEDEDEDENNDDGEGCGRGRSSSSSETFEDVAEAAGCMLRFSVDRLMDWIQSTPESRLRVGPMQTVRAATFHVHSNAVSLHLPLHRMVALVALRMSERGLALPGARHFQSLLGSLSTSDPTTTTTTTSPRPDLMRQYLGLGLIEHPLRALVFSGQVKAGLWRRNGAAVASQEMHYGSPGLGRCMRDLDLAAGGTRRGDHRPESCTRSGTRALRSHDSAPRGVLRLARAAIREDDELLEGGCYEKEFCQRWLRKC